MAENLQQTTEKLASFAAEWDKNAEEKKKIDARFLEYLDEKKYGVKKN